jgi:hypothetical protein
MSNTPYSIESQQAIDEAMQMATLMFDGQSPHTIVGYDRHTTWQTWGYNFYAQESGAQSFSASAWDDYRNWFTIENGEVVGPANRCPNNNDHVIIKTPVAIGGNGRIPYMPECELDSNSDTYCPFQGQVPDAFYFRVWGGCPYKEVEGIIPTMPSLDQIASGAQMRCDVTDPITGETTSELSYSGIVNGPTKGARIPTPISCASATFLNNTFICLDERIFDITVGNDVIQGLPPFIIIGFPCIFHGNSFVSTRSTTPRATAVKSHSGFITTASYDKFVSFLHFTPTSSLHFYDTSKIQKTRSAHHDNYGGAGVISLGSEMRGLGFVGSLRLECDIHYYGDQRVELSSSKGTVFFHDTTQFGGGIITKAEFLDNSKTIVGTLIQEPEYQFYAIGPQLDPKGSVIFRGSSVNQWPLRCKAEFKDSSLCLIPFFNNTTFDNNSVYSWELLWTPPTYGGSNPVHFWDVGLSSINRNYNIANSTTIFRGSSTNLASKVLTQAPTRFYENGKILIERRFSDISGYLPKNYSGSFGALSYDAGKGADIASNSNHDYHWCSHAHQKTGSRVSLIVEAPATNGGPPIEGESSPEVHIVTCAPFIYAEFHDFKGNGDWGDPENWTRIGGRYDLLPNVRTIVRIKSGKHVTNNSRSYASCGGLIIEDGSSINIPLNSISIIFNYGILGSTIENVNDLLMLGNSSNIGRVKQAGQTYFADQARNYKDQDDGFIRSGAIFVMAPRTINFGIGGVIEVGAMPAGPSDWMNMSSFNFFSGGAVPTPETTFYNYAHQCIGKYLYQTD